MPNITGKIGLPTPDQLKSRLNAAKSAYNKSISGAVNRTYAFVERLLEAEVKEAIDNVRSDSELTDITAYVEIYDFGGAKEHYEAEMYDSQENQLKSLIGDKPFDKLCREKTEREYFATKFKAKAEKENPGWSFDVHYKHNHPDSFLRVHMYLSSAD